MGDFSAEYRRRSDASPVQTGQKEHWQVRISVSIEDSYRHNELAQVISLLTARTPTRLCRLVEEENG